ncbi:MAG: hypothetical protein ABII00_09510 [Elusimicrobiota bacterium]
MKRLCACILAASFLGALPGAVLGQLCSKNTMPIGEPQPIGMAEEGGDPWKFDLGGNVGAASITNPRTGETEIFNTISLQPELAFGKLGVGLDLFVYFDSDGKAREEDWDTAEDFVSKIWYARWGSKGEKPVYARLGGLANTTIGHGFIMGGYTNRLDYPNVRKVGALLDLDAGWVGFESVLTDVRRATLLGGRVYARPMHGGGLPVLEGMAIGLTGVTDRDPDDNKGTQNDQVSVYGVDLDLPILKQENLSAKLYADGAVMHLGSRYTTTGGKNYGKGLAAGLGAKVFFLDARAEMRSIENNFVPNFFDGYYDIDRFTSGAYKADTIAGTASPRRTGPLVELFADILGKVTVGGSYESLNVDPLAQYPRVRAEARTDPSLLLGKFSLASRYEQRNVDKWSFIGRTRGPDTIITSEIAYMPNANLRIVGVMKQTFDEMGRPVRTTQFRSDVRF